jgi:hypothetical protein
MWHRWGTAEVHSEFWRGDLMEGEQLEYLGTDRMIILKWIFKKWNGGIDWIYLAQDRNRWRGLVNVMSLWVP